MNKIKFAKPLINFQEKKEVLKVLNSGIYSQANKCREFEKKFKKFTKAKFASTKLILAQVGCTYFTILWV